MERVKMITIQKATYLLLLIILFFYAVIEAKQVLIPISLGFLFATLMYPAANFLEVKLKFPKTLANLASVLLFVACIVFGIILLKNQINIFVDDFPALKLKALANLEYLRLFIEENFGVDSASQHLWLRERVNGLFESGSSVLSQTINATTGTLFKLFLLPVFMFYMLDFRERFRNFIIKISSEDRQEQAKKVMHDISIVIQRYVSGVFTVVLVLCFLNSLGLYIVGLKYAIIFGIISALFNLIPYFGTWIGAAFPITFALLTGDSPQLAVSVFLLFMIIQFTENNILTPNITGGYVKLNPLVTILSIIIGGIVWGVTGMLIVIPFMATVKILFDNFEPTKPYAYALSSDARKKIKINIFKRKKDNLGSDEK